MIHLANFSYVYVCCHVMQIHYYYYYLQPGDRDLSPSEL